MNSQQAIRQAIQAIQNDDTETGKQLLAQVLRADPTNVEAWLWMSDVVDSDEKKRDCLRQVLALDPQNQTARRKMADLLATAASKVAADSYTPGKPPAGLTPGFAAQRSRVASKPTLTAAQRKRGYRNTMLAGAMLLSVSFLFGNLALQYGAARLPANVTSVVMLTEATYVSSSQFDKLNIAVMG